MFERFSDEARRVLVHAQEESRRLSHDYIGTEHLLLGLIKDDGSIATQALVSMGLDLDTARERVETIIGTGNSEAPSHMPLTPRAKRILELSLQEAVQLRHDHIGTEHMLLGLLRESDGIAAQVLNWLGIELEPARERVTEMVGLGESPAPWSTERASTAPDVDFGPMFKRFTDRARRVVVHAQEEARLLNHNYIGTEHLLLGLLIEKDGLASRALGQLGVTDDAAREKVRQVVGVGEKPPSGAIAFTPRAKRVFELSLKEALQLGHNYIGTEHFVLGLVAEGGGIALEVLRRLDVEPHEAYQEMMEVLGDPEPVRMPRREPPPVMAVPERERYDPALASVLFVTVALVAVVIEPPQPDVRLWGLSLLLGGVLLWAGGALIGTGAAAGPRSRNMGQILRTLGGLALAAAASVFVLGALVV